MIVVQALSSASNSITLSAVQNGSYIFLLANNLTNGSATTVPTAPTGFTWLSGTTNAFQYNTSANTGFFGYKKSTGGETVLTVTGGAGSITGVVAIEVAGLGTATIGTPTLQNNLTSTPNSSGLFTSTNANSIILFLTGAPASTGGITFDAALTAFTNTGLVAQGAYSIPGTIVTSKTYANTNTAGRTHGNMVIEITPSASNGMFLGF
jgi:hypothetical protein